MDRYVEIKKRLLNIAESDEDLCAVIAIGSSARNFSEADEFSDLDLILICNNPNKWIFGDMPAKLGEIRISFTELTLGGCLERRVLYDGSLDVDFVPLTNGKFEEMINNGIACEVMCRGYSILYDCIGITNLIEKRVVIDVRYSVMAENDFINMVNDFWYHMVWTSKKILRGELWTAKMCIDAYMKNYLLKIIELDRAKTDNLDVWHSGRFLEKWAGEKTVKALADCFSHYEKEDMISALFNTAKLFGTLARSVAQKCSYEYPIQEEKYALSLFKSYFA